MKQKAYIIDTHPLIWYFNNQNKLSKTVLSILNSSQSNYTLIIPVVVLVEIKYLINIKRINLIYQKIYKDLSSESYIEIALFDDYMIDYLPTNLNIHDAMIVATALFYRDFIGFDVDLITKDKEIIDSNIVNTIW